MTPAECPELEILFAELEAGEGPALDHAAECPLCSAMLEEHRQLEKDLFRLADPLPPPALVTQVMARVAAEPPPLRRELWSGLAILIASVCLGLGLLIGNDQSLSRLGTALAALVTDSKAFIQGLASGASALWHTEAGPVTAVLLVLLLVSLFGLRRLAGNSPSLSEA